jgi:hypothetical protein
MNVLLAHDFRGGRGWIEGKAIQTSIRENRWDIVNREGNRLIQNAPLTFLDSLKNKGLLKEDTAEKCEYCGDLWEDCTCGAQCPDD